MVGAGGFGGGWIDVSNARIAVQGTVLFVRAAPVPFDRDAVRESLKKREIRVEIDLGMGTSSAAVWTCDLSPEYVRSNGEYTT